MADVVSAVRTYLLGVTAVTDAIGQRMYFDRLVQGADFPAVVVWKASESYSMQLGSRTGLVDTRLTFECIDEGPGARLAANATAQAILRSGIDAVKGTTNGVDIRGVAIEDGQRNYTDDARDGGDQNHRYITTFDLMVSHLES